MSVRMRFTISGEYDAEINEAAYGTTDPEEMAEVDEALLRQDPSEFADEATEFSVRVIRADRPRPAPPGYRSVGSDKRFGSCGNCGAVVNLVDLVAKLDHEQYHVNLNMLWTAVHQSGSARAGYDPPPGRLGAPADPDPTPEAGEREPGSTVDVITRDRRHDPASGHKMPPAPPQDTTPGGVEGANQHKPGAAASPGAPPADPHFPRGSAGTQRSRPGNGMGSGRGKPDPDPGREPRPHPRDRPPRTPEEREQDEHAAYEAWLAQQAATT